MMECKLEFGKYYFRTEKKFHVIDAKNIVRVQCEERADGKAFNLDIIIDLKSTIDVVSLQVCTGNVDMEGLINLFETNIPFDWRVLNV